MNKSETKKRITLTIDEICVTFSWLSNSLDGADDSESTRIIDSVVKKLSRHLAKKGSHGEEVLILKSEVKQ